MKRFSTLASALTLLATFAFVGCGEAPDDHEGHDHGAKDQKDGDGHGHGKGTELGTATVNGAELKLTFVGEMKPKAKLHIDIDQLSGEAPSAIRVWIGDEAATNAIKGKAMGKDGHYHADATVPDELLATDALWIEVEDAEGDTSVGSLPLKK